MKFSLRLKTWREKQGLTQAQAAKQIGVTLRTYENWEQGYSAPRGLALTALQAKLSEPSKRLDKKKPRKSVS